MLLQVFQRLMALLSIALFGVAAYLLWSWWDLRQALNDGVVYDDTGWRLWAGLALIAFSLLGRTPILWLLGRRGEDGDRLRRLEGRMIESPTGARLHVEEFGPPDAPALIFVHGWGLDAGIWREARLALSSRYRVIAYDLAGLGKSKGPPDGCYTLERFADDLLAVVKDVAPRRAVLIGHSIGGMTLQTFARRHPDALERDVAGLVLENTTHTDPTRTTVLGGALHAMKPVLGPMMKVDIALAPLVWLMNWQGYLSGSTHVAMRFGGFGGRPTRAQLEQVSRAVTKNHPAVQAKGNLAMMSWDATPDLPRIAAPMLVFIGGRDLVTVPAAGERIADGAPGGRPLRIERAGHLGPMELAQSYNEAIARFADEVFTRGATWADRRAEARLTGDASPAGPAMGDERPLSRGPGL